MKPAPLPSDETERLAALHRYAVLDTPAEAAFDDVTGLAALVCGTPIALVSLVDAERQWFKSRLGLEAPHTPRDVSFCGHAIHGRELFEVPDTLADERFRDNPLVTGAPNVRFYAGAPLVTPEGLALGTLCVIDHVPNRLTRAQREGLEALSRQVARLLELRLVARQIGALSLDLARKSAFQQALLESAALAIISITAEGVISSFNHAAGELFGYRSAELVGKPSPGIFYDRAEVAMRAEVLSRELGRRIEPGIEVFVAKARAGESESREWTFLRKDGSRVPVRLSVSALRDQAGALLGFLGIVRDISDRIRAEEQLRQANVELRIATERAQQADRLKSAFLATMSHELRTPLNSIIGFTGIILQGLAGPLNPEQTKQLGMVQASARHLLALINDVLDISKIEAGELKVDREPFDLPASIAKVVDIVKPLAEKKGLALRAEIATGLGGATGDARRVEQVLLNLLDNAIKFTWRGEIVLGADLIGDRVQLCVSDTGIGIRPEDMRTLFQPFRQIDDGLARNQEGTGLGLAICRRLAELMAGEIHARSEWGKGSSFSFSLPLKPPEKS